MLAGEGDLRLALAGAQSKLPVLLVDGNIALPAPGQPTSHILKPAIPRFEQTVDNEYYCLSLARAIGLRSEEHTSELQSLMRISYAVFGLKKKKRNRKRYII